MAWLSIEWGIGNREFRSEHLKIRWGRVAKLDCWIMCAKLGGSILYELEAIVCKMRDVEGIQLTTFG